MNLFLLCLLFPLISILFLHKQSQFRDEQLLRITGELQDQIEKRSATLARSVAISAEQAIDGYEFTFLNNLAMRLVEDDPEILYIVVQNNNNQAVVHSDATRMSLPLEDLVDVQAGKIIRNQFPQARLEGGRQSPVHILHWTGTGESDELSKCIIIEAITPLYSGAQLFGALRCAFSLDRFHKEISQAQTTWESAMREYKVYLLTLTGIFFSIGVSVAMLFTRYLLRPIEALNEGVGRVAAGNLDHEMVQQGLPCREFLALSATFNFMTRRLKISYQQLDDYSHSLEAKVDERTRELKEAQDNLLRQAHEAGMAEMAVGILHNIGNAMTPAKVGITHLLKLIARSPVRIHLFEVMAIIRKELEEASTLAPEKKKHLLEIAELLPQTIAEEYDELLDSLSRIRDKHEHMESIIRLQLRYARISSEAERIDLNAMVEDSLKMLDDQLEKRAITVIRNLSELPPVRIEKTKLIQIIINLIKNAYESLDGLEQGEKRLELTTYVDNNAPDQVVLSVKDNGMGFTEEEKSRFFTFGFSTKARGSGFGLHSCANYLIANQGSITAHSAGRGKGAEFIIRLPLEKKGIGDDR